MQLNSTIIYVSNIDGVVRAGSMVGYRLYCLNCGLKVQNVSMVLEILNF
jgi:hypothetical protein